MPCGIPDGVVRSLPPLAEHSARSQPPDHFALLGLKRREGNTAAIEGALPRQTTFVRQFQTGVHEQDATRLLNEIAAAGDVLLDPQQRGAYLAGLPQPEPDAGSSQAKEAAGGDATPNQRQPRRQRPPRPDAGTSTRSRSAGDRQRRR